MNIFFKATRIQHIDQDQDGDIKNILVVNKICTHTIILLVICDITTTVEWKVVVLYVKTKKHDWIEFTSNYIYYPRRQSF